MKANETTEATVPAPAEAVASGFCVPLQSRIDAGELDGYHAGGPPYNPAALVGGANLDAAIAAGSACSACGHLGVACCNYTADEAGEISALTGRPRYSWRSYAVCPACGHSEMF